MKVNGNAVVAALVAFVEQLRISAGGDVELAPEIEAAKRRLLEGGGRIDDFERYAELGGWDGKPMFVVLRRGLELAPLVGMEVVGPVPRTGVETTSRAEEGAQSGGAP